MTTDELYQAQMENRYLKETIAALREELEKERICFPRSERDWGPW